MTDIIVKDENNTMQPVNDNNDYSIFHSDNESLKESIQVNHGPEGINVYDLEKVEVDGSTWVMSTLEGLQETKEIQGIIIFQKHTRSYWEKSLDDGGEEVAPDCYSDNAEIGHGNPGGSCYTCPFAEWGSDPKGGKGQACQKKLILFLIMKEDFLPVVVSIPPTSLKYMKKYLMKLSSKGIAYYSIITAFTLQKEKSNGKEFSLVIPRMAEKLTDQQKSKVQAFHDYLKPVLTKQPIIYPESPTEG